MKLLLGGSGQNSHSLVVTFWGCYMLRARIYPRWLFKYCSGAGLQCPSKRSSCFLQKEFRELSRRFQMVNILKAFSVPALTVGGTVMFVRQTLVVAITVSDTLPPQRLAESVLSRIKLPLVPVTYLGGCCPLQNCIRLWIDCLSVLSPFDSYECGHFSLL